MDKLELIKINQWMFDPLKKTLTRSENSETIVETLESKHSSLLHCLIEHRGEIVSRDQLIEIVWNNRFIDDRTINATVSRLRKILGGGKDDFIKTHPKLGYSFTCLAEYLDRPTPEKIKIETKAKSNLTLYKVYAALLTGCFFVLLWFLLTNLEKPEVALRTDNLKIEPLTYTQGWEFQPSLSKDQSLLAFAQLKNNIELYHVYIQNITTKQKVMIEPEIQTSSPHWSMLNDELYYVSFANNECLIKKMVLDNKLVLSKPIVITSCGGEFNLPTIALSSDENWLYYIFDESEQTPSVIKRVHLTNNYIETLTTSTNKIGGDISFSLSNDNRNIAFIRDYDDNHSALMIQNIENGEVNELVDNKDALYSLSWTQSPFHLVFIDDNNTLFSIDIRTKKTTPIYKHSEVIIDPVFISDNELLLSFGDLYKANIKQVDINTKNVDISPLINSPFKDHSADVHNDGINESIAFVSNRSGSYQVWLQKQNTLTQLTNIETSNNYITDLSFSKSGQQLLFKINTQLHIYNLAKGLLTRIEHPSKIIRNAIWSCDSEDEILVIGKSEGVWSAIQINLTNFNKSTLESGITAIETDCANKEYIIAKQNQPGLFFIPSNNDKRKIEHVLNDYSFSNKNDWAFSAQKIYRLINNSNELLIFDTKTRTKKSIMLKNTNPSNIKSIGNKLIFNDLQHDDTYIGKITIPNI